MAKPFAHQIWQLRFIRAELFAKADKHISKTVNPIPLAFGPVVKIIFKQNGQTRQRQRFKLSCDDGQKQQIFLRTLIDIRALHRRSISDRICRFRKQHKCVRSRNIKRAMRIDKGRKPARQHIGGDMARTKKCYLASLHQSDRQKAPCRVDKACMDINIKKPLPHEKWLRFDSASFARCAR